MLEKKFINSPDTVVDDCLRGLVLSSGGRLKFAEGNSRVVIRDDRCSIDKVKLIAGGGSGHEPFPAGFVGEGMLDAAVCGDIFASPPSSNVLLALEETKCSAGALLFVINYTGDRLNFGLAAEKFKQNNGHVAVITIDDDISLERQSKTGRRGLAGVVFIIKMAGSMAARGNTLEEIVIFCEEAKNHIGTIGVSLSPCSLPGKSRMFEMGPNEMEIGLGIHGEPGKERIESKESLDIVNVLFDAFERNKKSNREIIVMLNNLGSTSQIELNVILGDILQVAKERGKVVRKVLVGSFMTSINGHGISLSILEIFSNWVTELLEAPVDIQAWNKGYAVNTSDILLRKPSNVIPIVKKTLDGTSKLTDEERKKLRGCILNVCNEMQAKEKELNELDGRTGDGDCGSTFARASSVVKKAIEEELFQFSDYSSTLSDIAELFEREVGGTSGAIYALILGAASSEIINGELNEIVQGMRKALDVIIMYGRAEKGDRTMVDAFAAAVSTLPDVVEENIDWGKVLMVTEKAALATAHMKANAGRAAYTSEHMQTEPDAGAMAFYYWIKVIINSFTL